MRQLTKVSEFPFDPNKKSDIRDVLKHYRDGKKAWEYLSGLLVEVDLDVPEEDIAPAFCTSFEELDATFRQHLHWTQKSSDALAVCMATVISLRIKGPLLWIYLIGPSGQGKSTICDSLSVDKLHIKRLNSFTGLHSGYKTGDPDNPDASLVSKLLGKAMIVPDFTSVLALSAQMQEKIYGELRNIFDGISSMHYGNNQEHEYTKITFPMIAGVTHEIHGLRKSALGERFLKIDMTEPEQWDSIIERTITNVASSASNSLEDNTSFDQVDELNPFMRDVKAHSLGFMQHLFKKVAGGVKVSLPKWFAIKLKAMATIVAAARGEAKRLPGADRDLAYRPIREVGSHVAGQLTKLAIALSVVLDREPDEEILRLVQKVAIDTAHGFSYDIISVLGDNPEGLMNDQIASKIRIAPSAVRRICEDLKDLGIVYRKLPSPNSTVSGREGQVLYLAPNMAACWEEVFGKPAPKREMPRQRA